MTNEENQVRTQVWALRQAKLKTATYEEQADKAILTEGLPPHKTGNPAPLMTIRKLSELRGNTAQEREAELRYYYLLAPIF